jgi:hypothetical protein
MSKEYENFSGKWLLSWKLRLRIMFVTFPSAIILGVIGYLSYHVGDDQISFTTALYHTAQLFVLHAPHFSEPVPLTLELARWLAAASSFLALFNTAVYMFHDERITLVLRNRRNHAIVCGLGRRGFSVVEGLTSSGQKVVAVDKSPEPEVVERLRRLGVPLITGDAARKEVLHHARIEHADQLYALCPEETTNFSIAMTAHDIECRVGANRRCFIHINDSELRNALQRHYRENQKNSQQKLHFIDAFESEAISLLVHDLPLDHDGIASSDPRSVHLIILGFGKMGRTIAVNAAQLGQFANRKKLRISVIDRHADKHQDELLFHHPFFKKVAKIYFYQQEVLSPKTRSLVEGWCNESGMIVNVVICFDNPSVVFDTVFNLLPVFNLKNVRVAVRINEPDSFTFLLNKAGAGNYDDLDIHPFGIEKHYENLLNPENERNEKFAMDIHKAYIKMRLEENKDKPDELEKLKKLDEMQPWDELSEDFRDSNRQQAMHINFKLRACGYEIAGLEDPRPAIKGFEDGLLEDLAIMEHNRWVAERRINNWKYGEPPDKKNRISNNLKDWKKLKPTIKEYDYIAVKRIPYLLKSIGKKMVEK